MIIAATSDLHGRLPEIDFDYDILVVAGDITPATQRCHENHYAAEAFYNGPFTDWLLKQKGQIIGIAGNHEVHEERYPCLKKLPWKYGVDEHIEVLGLKFWISPYTPWFFNWGFQSQPEDMIARCSKIDKDTDVIVCHGPPYLKRDLTDRGDNVGSKEAAEAYAALSGLKACIFGHIHYSYGSDGIYHNVAHCDEEYKPVNPVVRIEI